MCNTHTCHRGQTWPSAVSRETKKEVQQQFKKLDEGDRLTWDHSIPVLHSLSSCIIGNLVLFWTSIKGIYLRNVFHFSITIYLEETHFLTLLLFNKGFISAHIVHARGYQLVELENLHADRTIVCFEPWWKLRARLGARKTGLSPPVFLYWPFQGGTSVVVPYCSCCLCLYFGSAIMLVTYFVNFR